MSVTQHHSLPAGLQSSFKHPGTAAVWAGTFRNQERAEASETGGQRNAKILLVDV